MTETSQAERIAPPARRSFLNRFLGAGLGALGVAVFYPVARYLVPPRTGESSAASVTLPLKPAEVKSNSGTIFKYGSRPGLLIRTATGELRAFSAVCTHLGCTVQYRSDLGQIWCACHNGHFDLNGKNVSGPPPKPLEAMAVHVRGDQIVVRKGT
jgi:Rieske Fe-S protein